jgi:hypothetical protein
MRGFEVEFLDNPIGDENEQAEFALQNVCRLQKSDDLAKEVGEGLGRSQIL